jgi:hypothetical protein
MPASSSAFRDRVRERILDLVWRQWVAIGVPGYVRNEETQVVDLEALLVLTMTVGRHEMRLFDEVVAWLRTNGDLINVQRLRALLKRSSRETVAAVGAIAQILGRRSTVAAKWKQLENSGGLEQPLPFFLQRDGRPVPTPATRDAAFARRGLLRSPVPEDRQSRTFPREGAAALLLRLRALLGVSLRCEILCVLGEFEEVHPSRLARLIGTPPRTMQKLLAEMERSGYVQVRAGAREKQYSLVPGPLADLLRPEGPTPWRNSIPLFRALEKIWHEVVAVDATEFDPIEASSRWRRLARDVRPMLADAELASAMRDDKAYRGEAYAEIFQVDLTRMVDGL